ncbi:hypothetical protein Hanom_Chr12g01140961 [Helianthus anomalus]
MIWTPRIIKTNTTTIGRNSEDPIKTNTTKKTSTLQIANELWNSVQLILQAQRNLVETNYNSHLEFIRNMVDARYKDTQEDIRNFKEHLFKLTSSTLTSIFEKEDDDDDHDDDDDAKKGEKYSLRKLPADSKAKRKQKVQQQAE